MAREPLVRHDDKQGVRAFVHVRDIDVVLARHGENAVVRELLHIAVDFGKIARQCLVARDEYRIDKPPYL